MEKEDPNEIIGRFKMLPAQFQGKTVEVEVVVGNFSAADAEICHALGLPEGDTIKMYETSTLFLSLYASGSTASKLLDEKLDTKKIRIVAKMVYGVNLEEIWAGDESKFKRSDELGLLIESYELLG